MKFLPKDLCEKVLALGCKSNSDYAWGFFDWIDGYEWQPIPNMTNKPAHYKIDTYGMQLAIFSQQMIEYIDFFDPPCPAFCFEDFAGTTEQARENARLVFGMGHMDCERAHLCPTCLLYSDMAGIKKRYYYIADMLHSSDWIEFIRPHIEKAYEDRMGK